MRRVAIESPLAGDFERNKRYALWCGRHCYLLGEAAYASHLFYPQFLNDQDPVEREFGIMAGFEWAKDGDRIFYIDLGWSPGMLRARDAMGTEALPHGLALATEQVRRLPPELLAKFEAGEYPSATSGFGRRTSRQSPDTTRCSFCDKASSEVAFMVAREGKSQGQPAICDECMFASAKHMFAAGWRQQTIAAKVESEPEPG
jgi:hypothetical protein